MDKERFAIPKELYKLNHQKQLEIDPKPLIENDMDGNDVSDSTLGESLPCAQPRAESTIVLGPQ